MSTTKVTVIIVILVVIVGGLWWYSQSNGSMSPSQSTSTANVMQPATSAPANTNISPTDDSDQALQQDSSKVDTQMNGLGSDSSTADQSVNSQ